MQAETIQLLLKELRNRSELTPPEQLALLTQVRKVLASKEDPDIYGILSSTDIIQVCIIVLNFTANGALDDLVPYMKLETLWLIINLFYGDIEELDIILGLQKLPGKDFAPGEYEILILLNKLLCEQMSALQSQHESFDMRIVSNIYFAFHNLAVTHSKFA